MQEAESSSSRRILIIGAGFSGLCLGIQLKQAGIHSFTIVEKARRLGGTWRDNTYPGAACDVPSMSYCFSFEQKTDWSRKWSPQPEILAYMEHCAEKYDLTPHLRFDSEILDAQFDEARGVWRVRTAGGEEIEADVLVSAVGQLARPRVPKIPGLDRFDGTCFHSARWNHGYDMAGARVAVIGNAASAIQFIPQIATQAGHLIVFQRSANWMLPRMDRAYRDTEKQRFSRYPRWARLTRWRIWARFELQFPVFRRPGGWWSKVLERLSVKSMRSLVPDLALQDTLIPDYPIGGKRMLISDDYYQALARDNVDVVTSPIERVEEDAVVTVDGVRHPVDALVLATGFETTAFLAPMKIVGRDRRSLAEEWKDGAKAYLGLSVHGFPNFFMMYGPNTNLGHNSILFMIECQSRYIVQCVQALSRRGLHSLDVREDVMRTFNHDLQAKLAKTTWAAPDRSWYKTADGRITNNWSSTTTRYWWLTRKLDLSDYQLKVRPRAHDLRYCTQVRK